MPTLKIMHISYDGDDAGVIAALKEIERMFADDDVARIEPIEPIDPIAPPEMKRPKSPDDSKTKPAPARTSSPTIEQRSTLSPPPLPVSNRKLAILCKERSGDFDVNSAAKLADTTPATIHAVLHKARNTGQEWAKCRKFHFKRATPDKRNDPKPMFDGTDVPPINPTRVACGEKPTPKGIAAD